MCDYCENEDKIAYDFTFLDQHGLQNHMCKEDILIDEDAELPQLLEAFRQFVNVCGYTFVDTIIAKGKTGVEVSSDEY